LDKIERSLQEQSLEKYKEEGLDGHELILKVYETVGEQMNRIR